MAVCIHSTYLAGVCICIVAGGGGGGAASSNCNMQDVFESLDHNCELPLFPMIMTQDLVMDWPRPWLTVPERPPTQVEILLAEVPRPAEPGLARRLRPLDTASGLPAYVLLPAALPLRPIVEVVVPVPAVGQAEVPMPAMSSAGPADVPMPAMSSAGPADVPMPPSSSAGPADVPMLASSSAGPADVPVPASSSADASADEPMPASASAAAASDAGVRQPRTKARSLARAPSAVAPPASPASWASTEFELEWTPLHSAINDQRGFPLRLTVCICDIVCVRFRGGVIVSESAMLCYH